MSTPPPPAATRIVCHCETCGVSMDGPASGLGRAMAGAWETQHQGHQYTREQK